MTDTPNARQKALSELCNRLASAWTEHGGKLVNDHIKQGLTRWEACHVVSVAMLTASVAVRRTGEHHGVAMGGDEAIREILEITFGLPSKIVERQPDGTFSQPKLFN